MTFEFLNLPRGVPPVKEIFLKENTYFLVLPLADFINLAFVADLEAEVWS